MRQFTLVLTLGLALLAGSTAWSQNVIWNPCGCGDSTAGCGSCTGTTGSNGCGVGACGACQGGLRCGSNSGTGFGTGCGEGCCLNLHDPTYFQPWNDRPFGSYNQHIMQTQRRNGLLAQLVFQQYDFAYDSMNQAWSLSQAGAQDARKIARLWSMAPGKVLVEPTGEQAWDNARRELALQALNANGANCSDDDVQVGTSPILGLVPDDPVTHFNSRQLPAVLIPGYAPALNTGGDAGFSGSATSGSGSNQ